MLPPEIITKLDDPSVRFSIAIRHKLPHIDRLWLKSGESRLCLHRLYPLPPPGHAKRIFSTAPTG